MAGLWYLSAGEVCWVDKILEDVRGVFSWRWGGGERLVVIEEMFTKGRGQH